MNRNILKSSEGNGASMTVVGGGVGLVTIAMFFAQTLGLPLTEADIVTLITQVGTIVSSGAILYGIVRKVVNHFVA